MCLTNVDYSSTLKAYVFNGNSYGNLGESIIPKTGDFTIEARITYPENIQTVTDQSIVSQVSDTSNDTGRFKLDAQVRNGKNDLLVFMNDQKGNTNPFVSFTTSPTLGKTYLLQVTRKDNKLSTYLDGQLSSTYTLNVESPISQASLKLGKWNNNSTQYYTGSIFSLRIYIKALDYDKLISNKKVDDDLYEKKVSEEEKPTTLVEYIKTYHQVTTGNGVYIDNIGNYIYRGDINTNNYLKFKDNDDLYRIISIDSNNTIKIINTASNYNIPYDESGNRTAQTDTFCKNASSIADSSLNQMYGCNAWSTFDNLITNASSGTVTKDASINTYLNTTIYDSLPNSIKEKVLTHNFYIGTGASGTTRDSLNELSIALTWSGKIGLMTLADLLNANISSQSISTGTVSSTNYLTSIGTGQNVAYWSMTQAAENTWDVYTAVKGNQIGKRRVSRYYQMDRFYKNNNVCGTIVLYKWKYKI